MEGVAVSGGVRGVHGEAEREGRRRGREGGEESCWERVVCWCVGLWGICGGGPSPGEGLGPDGVGGRVAGRRFDDEALDKVRERGRRGGVARVLRAGGGLADTLSGPR